MAYRLGNQVLYGEIAETGENRVQGFLQLRDRDERIVLDLTGCCDPDLAGCHIRFVVKPHPMHADGDTAFLQQLQQGEAGNLTAARMIRAADCSIDELLQRSKLNEPPPMEWKRCLYLEWYGPNGRVVAELIDPEIEFLAGEDRGVEEPPADTGDEIGPQSTAIHLGDDGEVEISDLTGEQADDELDAQDDPYGLFPDDLQKQLDERTAEIDDALEETDDDSASDDELQMTAADEQPMAAAPAATLPSAELLEATHEFPGPYTFKVIGRAEGNFIARAVAGVREELAADSDPPFRIRQTSGGRHVSVTLEPIIQTAEQVLAVYSRIYQTTGLVMVF